MNSWEIIKKAIVTNARPHSVGRQLQLALAGRIIADLAPNLSDKDEARDAMFADQELVEAMLNAEQLIQLTKEVT